MPSDFLRDVLRTDDAARRAPRRWPLFPLSLAVHALGAAACFVIPLAAEVTPPTPRPLHADWRVLVRVLPPEPVIRQLTEPLKAEPDPRPLVTRPASPHASTPTLASGILGIVNDTSWSLNTSGDPQPLPGVPTGPATTPGVSDGRRGTSSQPDTTSDARPLKIGGKIRAPQRLSAAPPIYPPIAQSARVAGLVILEALIDVNGRVADVRVLKSIPLLDAAAVDAVRTWRYTPTLLNGVPVSVLMTVTVNFTLQR